MSDVSDELLNCEPAQTYMTAVIDTPLYHYTSPRGLLGIADGRIWATDCLFLNDLKELDHTWDMASQRAAELKYASRAGSYAQELLAQFMERDTGRRLGIRDPRLPRFFVASFSEHGDLLSQWRAYCPPGGGYSVGFPLRHLRVMRVEGCPIYVGRCVYDPKDQRAIVEALLSGAIERYRSLCEGAVEEKAKDPKFRRRKLKEALDLLGRSLRYFAPLMKHAAFREEGEWRVVIGPVDADNSHIKYRDGSGCLVPFIEFPLRTNEVDLRAARAIVWSGPSSMKDRATATDAAFVKRMFGNDAKHQQSRVPYKART